MMIGSKGPSDALARSLETLIDPPNTNGVVIFHRKMTRAVSVPAAHCTRSVRAADHQLGAKYLLTLASYDDEVMDYARCFFHQAGLGTCHLTKHRSKESR